MKNFKFTAILLTTAFLSCSENTKNDEQEIRNLIASYDEAAAKSDVAFFEKNLASDYQMSSTEGNIRNKETSLKLIKEDLEEPSYKLISLKSDSVNVHIVGDMAVVTGKWLSTVQSLKDPLPVMHDDEGRYTSILEKRNGQWLMIAEQVSEKPHNKQELETQLKATSENYDKGLLAQDRKIFEELFAEDYVATGREGRLINKEESINQIISPNLKILTSKTDDKNFRIYRNTAVETGRFSDSGTYNGKPFSETGRYTTTWVYRDGKWRVVADHTSPMPDSK